jgi:hypothetical protein
MSESFNNCSRYKDDFICTSISPEYCENSELDENYECINRKKFIIEEFGKIYKCKSLKAQLLAIQRTEYEIYKYYFIWRHPVLNSCSINKGEKKYE